MVSDMLRIILPLIMCFSWPFAALAAQVPVNMTAEYTGLWQTAGGASYVEDDYGARHRVAVRVFADNVAVGMAWDNPSDREIDFTVDWDDASRRVKRFVATTWCFSGGPWEAGRQHAIGDLVAVGNWPDGTMQLAARRTGDLLLSSKMVWFTKGQAVLDNGNGTVNIPVMPTNPFAEGEIVALRKMGSYDGVYTLPTQASVNYLTITAAYAAFSVPDDQTQPNARLVAGSSGGAEPTWPTPKVLTDGVAVVDNGNGTVNLPCTAHGFTEGNEIVIHGTATYDGTHVLPAQASPDWLTVTATYSAVTIAGKPRAVRRYTVDNGVTWETLPQFLNLPSMSSYPSNRVIMRGQAGVAGGPSKSGIKFRYGSN